NILVAVDVDLPVIWPLHPGTLARIKTANLERHLKGIRIIEPLGYFEFFKLMLESSGVVTDSGGIQEETAHLGIACATLRDNTERPITLEIGSNKLFPPASANARDVLAHFARRDFKKGHIPLWDKDVSKRILDVLSR